MSVAAGEMWSWLVHMFVLWHWCIVLHNNFFLFLSRLNDLGLKLRQGHCSFIGLPGEDKTWIMLSLVCRFYKLEKFLVPGWGILYRVLACRARLRYRGTNEGPTYRAVEAGRLEEGVRET